jgi:carboxyl-terminal processing protease
VTFSALCEVYELLQEWHVDRPLDPATLAVHAIDSVTAAGSPPVEPPRVLECAVPTEDFVGFCERLSEVVTESGEPVGPIVDAAVVAMVERALGPFTFYLRPEEVPNTRADGVVGGVGVVLDATDAVGSRCVVITDACPLVVVFVVEGNPGVEAGLAAGDRIVAVDGVAVTGMGFAAAGQAIAGDETGLVTITIERGADTFDLAIERRELVGPLVEADLPVPGVSYLRIPNFSFEVPGLVRQALEALAPANSPVFVIDLRDNPGGYLDSVIVVASEFIRDGAVFSAGYGDQTEVFESTGEGLGIRARLIVLVNRGTASAAEVLAGALRDRLGATVVGTETFGKDAVQIPFDLRNGGQLFVTVARWATPGGDTVSNGGLRPDVELDLGTATTTEDLVEAVLEVTG